jgi:hypothetical protein
MNIRYVIRHGKRIEVETIETGTTPERRRGRFVRVPERWLKKLSGMSLSTRWLAVVLLWKSFQNYGRVFSCPNLEDFGISRRQKRKGLVELERAGMILVHRARRKSPRVKIALGLDQN